MTSVLVGPPLGDDYRLVSGFTTATEAVSRLFLPLRRRDGTFLRWSAAAAAVSSQLTATTRWPELEVAGTSSMVRLGDPQQGTVNTLTANRLIAGLRRGSIETLTMAMWTGYGGEIDVSLGGTLQPIMSPAGSYLADGSFAATTQRVEWLATRTLEKGYRFPCALWTPDFSFVMAAWMYQDSYYISTTSEITETLSAEGLELLAIDRNAPVPSVGD